MDMNYKTHFLEVCQNIDFNEYENHCSKNIQPLHIISIISRYNHIHNGAYLKNIAFQILAVVSVNCNILF